MHGRDKLVRNADGSYTATLQDQTTWSMGSNGKLLAITDRYGNRSLLTYSNGLPSTVGGPAGR